MGPLMVGIVVIEPLGKIDLLHVFKDLVDFGNENFAFS